MAGVTPMNERLSLLLSCYLDGALSPGELDEVVEALESSEQMVAEFRRLQESRRAVRLLPMLDMPLYLVPGEHLGEQLSAYLDGELATIEMPAVTSHIDTCSECRRELAALDRSRIAVRSLPGVEPPEFLAVHREETENRRRGLRTALAVVSGVAAVTLAFTLGPFASESEPVAVSITDLQFRHTAIASVPSSGFAVRVTNAP